MRLRRVYISSGSRANRRRRLIHIDNIPGGRWRTLLLLFHIDDLLLGLGPLSMHDMNDLLFGLLFNDDRSLTRHILVRAHSVQRLQLNRFARCYGEHFFWLLESSNNATEIISFLKYHRLMSILSLLFLAPK